MPGCSVAHAHTRMLLPPPTHTHMLLLRPQLINQLDAELGIEKFRAELESTQVLVSFTLTHPHASSRWRRVLL